MNIEKKIQEIIQKCNLINKNDKVVVALSGGKDSTTVLYVLHKLGYNVEGLMIDLHLGDWSEMHKKNMIEFCKTLGIKLNIIDLRKELGSGICFIKRIVKEKKNLSGCTVCGIIKKYLLNKWAKKLNADKIATGHNLDDECQNVLMNFLKGNVLLGMGAGPRVGVLNKENNLVSCKCAHPPTLCGDESINRKINNMGKDKVSQSERSDTGGFVQRIKPLFFVPENEIRKYAKKMKFKILYDKCPCAFGTYRTETREWMKNFSDKEKFKIVNGFQKIIPKLKKKYGCDKIMECRICGEASRGEVCNACKIFGCLKN